jgi:uncharacterized protein
MYPARVAGDSRGAPVRYPRAMPIIDVHFHAFPDALAPSALASMTAGGHIEATNDGTVSGVVGAMDRAGIDVGVVLPVATKPSQVRSINDWIAGTASDRIVPFGAMHPDLDDPASEVARMASLGLRGFKLHPEHQAFAPHDPRLDPIYAAAVEHGLVVFFHAGEDLLHDTLNGTPAAFAAMLDAWPGLRCVLAHMGGFRQWSAVRERLLGRDVWFDTAYTLGHLPDDEFVALARDHGADRVLFGSDGPWTDAGAELAHLRSLPLTPVELAGILGGNAVRLLGL